MGEDLKLNFENTSWWWQFGCMEGSTPKGISKFTWKVKIKSMQHDVLFKTCVVSYFIWHKSKRDVAVPNLESSKVVMSFL